MHELCRHLAVADVAIVQGGLTTTLAEDTLATLLAAEVDRQVDYVPVETDGAARAAARLAQLL